MLFIPSLIITCILSLSTTFTFTAEKNEAIKTTKEESKTKVTVPLSSSTSYKVPPSLLKLDSPKLKLDSPKPQFCPQIPSLLGIEFSKAINNYSKEVPPIVEKNFNIFLKRARELKKSIKHLKVELEDEEPFKQHLIKELLCLNCSLKDIGSESHKKQLALRSSQLSEQLKIEAHQLSYDCNLTEEMESFNNCLINFKNNAPAEVYVLFTNILTKRNINTMEQLVPIL